MEVSAQLYAQATLTPGQWRQFWWAADLVCALPKQQQCFSKNKQTNSVALSPRANYTD
jgi:hypothetical protein